MDDEQPEEFWLGFDPTEPSVAFRLVPPNEPNTARPEDGTTWASVPKEFFQAAWHYAHVQQQRIAELELELSRRG